MIFKQKTTFYDLVIMDIRMPELGGIEALKKIKVNCPALPEKLLESELFGHEKGSFTEAIAPKQGRFQLAHKSSIFLDEIAEIAPTTPAKILRVLQVREFEPLGGIHTINVDTRIIAATNKPEK